MANLFQEIVFWILAALSIVGALGVVVTRNMFRAALLLVVSFVGVAGLFALVNAEFLAVVQVLVYAGGVAVLVIFAVMITRTPSAASVSTRLLPVALVSSIGLFSALAAVITRTDWNQLPASLPYPIEEIYIDTPSRLGSLVLGDYVLAFEIAGVVLLAAVIGALSLVRER